MKQTLLTNGSRQNGYTLVMVTIFLFIIGAASIQFFNRSTESVKISGASRDSSQSLMLAEAAMEYLRGKFINNLNTDTDTVREPSCGTTGNDTLDKCEAADIQKHMSAPDTVLFHYMYYTTTQDEDGVAQGITEIIPEILQKVATSEKNITTPQDLTSISPLLSGPSINKTQATLGINDLFIGGSQHPFLFGVDANGALTALDFSSETSKWTNAWFRKDELEAQSLNPQMKAAAWLEIIKNPDDETGSSVDVFVQAAAQVGYAKSYTQRYVGSYFNSSELGDIALLSEATNPSN